MTVALLIGWLVVIPTAVVLLRLRRARYAEAAVESPPLRRPCEVRHRSPRVARHRHLI
jgi:hypothetical protein